MFFTSFPLYTPPPRHCSVFHHHHPPHPTILNQSALCCGFTGSAGLNINYFNLVRSQEEEKELVFSSAQLPCTASTKQPFEVSVCVAQGKWTCSYINCKSCSVHTVQSTSNLTAMFAHTHTFIQRWERLLICVTVMKLELST